MEESLKICDRLSCSHLNVNAKSPGTGGVTRQPIVQQVVITQPSLRSTAEWQIVYLLYTLPILPAEKYRSETVAEQSFWLKKEKHTPSLIKIFFVQ